MPKIPAFLLLFLLLSLGLFGCGKPSSTSTPPAEKNAQRVAVPQPSYATAPATYVGSGTCQTCHQAEYQQWQGSHHQQAMMPVATEGAVLGNFAAPALEHHQQQSTFHGKNKQYRISTDQNTASAATLELQYTFGVFPLQQYLTALPSGHWQSLPFAWDSRPSTQGGQQWFHLYADEKVVPGDVLHWRSPSHNANHMCIECHTTNFAKNFDAQNNSFHSTWQEVGVGCESCHGPASNHLAWAKDPQTSQLAQKGFAITLTSGALNLWQHQTDTQKPVRLSPGDSQQIEQCAQCHSRRGRINASNHEKYLLDAFLPSLLDETLYHPDGQIQDEVYEYGSFLQSKMAQQGVTCSNCHNPHSNKVKIEGNGLCLQCHNATYDTPQHTMHSTKQAGSFCIDCHMPTKTYMTVDVRRDHSMRIPRPDLSQSIDTPNACNNCHTDKSAAWAASAIDQHTGTDWKKPHYGETLYAARLGKPSSYSALQQLILDSKQAAIVRASAISLLGNFPTRNSLSLIADMLGNADPLIRLGALRVAELIPPQQQASALMPLLQDERRAIRSEAARILAGNPAVQNDSSFSRARQEYIDSQQINADRASALTNLASLAIREQRMSDAETLLQTAIQREPYYIPASINLSDLYRSIQRESDAERVLQTAMKTVPDSADLRMAYALWLVRNKQIDSATLQLQQATQHSDDPHLYYLYALALSQQGNTEKALTVLDKAATLPSYNRDVRLARVDIAMQSQQAERAAEYLAKWKAEDPEDPAVIQLSQQQ